MALELLLHRRMVAITVVWVFSYISGCLMPPDTDELSPVENRPPRILHEKLSPWPSDGPMIQSLTCERYLFSATVTDPDQGDRLYWRIFLDYYRDPRPEEAEGGEASLEAGTVTLEFYVNPNDSHFSSLLTEPHLVELLVADRPFFEDSRFPRGRALPDDALTASAQWTIRLTQVADQETVKCPTP